MKQFSILKQKLLMLIVLIATSVSAQQKLTKVSQSINVDKDVTIDLNTSHCNIVFDTWNKDVIEVEAYIEGDNLSNEELQKALKNWNVDVDATKSTVSISTKGNSPVAWSYSYNDGDNSAITAVLEELKFELADIEVPEIDIEIPEMPEMPEMPELPELPDGLHQMQFDYDAYKKDGDAYMEKWTKKFDSKFGKDYQKKIEEWGEKFGKEWGEKYGKQMEEWGEKFAKEWEEKHGEEMTQWGEEYAKQMEERAKRIEELHKRREEIYKKRADAREKLSEKREKQREEILKRREELADERRVKIEKMIHNNTDSKVKKTIKIKMPKDAKLKVNVRYGELKFASNIDNLKADLSHTKLIAPSINGSKTSINASYSPVYVANWNLGTLNLNYVKQAELDNVKRLMLTSNASNIVIKNLINSAIIDGSIGDLKVLKIDDVFTNLNVTLQNTDAFITLPKSDYSLQYKGTRSRFSHPKMTSKENENISNFSVGDLTSAKTIVVNAKYSNIIMK
ncbi:hypothetical protein [Yeosuana marina]|uniref:hypothetical protein n=1 Tax=Yeosuana marina TaxID=1565536 RepID=UPI00142000FB|nr:hypothetical protein [Yeosuana marina]